ncbi:MAG TPA: MFS transporter [Mycobacteriales bacterium]|nr:MFS transporter [Mycobacteriales bacterium]
MFAMRTAPRPSRTKSIAGATGSVAALSALHLGVDAVSGSISALMPAIADRFQLGATEVGALVGTFSASSLLMQPLAGRMADRIGARRLAITGAIVSSALLGLVGIAGHVSLLVAALVVGGFGSAAFHPAAAVVARRVMPHRAQFAVGLFAAGGTVGLAAGPLLVLLIAAHAGAALTPAVMVPGIAFAIVLWRVVPPDPPTTSPKSHRVTHELLRGDVGRLAVAATLVATAVTTFSAGIPLWLTQQMGYGNDAAVIGSTLAVFQLAAAGGGLAAGYAVRRMSPARLSAATLLAATVPLSLVLALTPGGVAFFVATAAAGALTTAAIPQLIVAAQDRAPHAVAAATGILIGLSMGVAGIAFIAIGALGDAAGLRVGLMTGFAAVIPAAALAHRVLRDDPTSSRITGLAAALGCGCVRPAIVLAASVDEAPTCTCEGLDACCLVHPLYFESEALA